ncbi:YhgE/Pip domain-containing protein [Bacillus aquiflavi]|uniref:YhgE/Pip domain-containing protein n=1 Tax=Bacillus aquiflavi TaxID=2672567 RepID=UPI00223B956E|nr:YhgE/Pip domain-containing protein [Bacillus aquiflavi]
MMKRILTIYKNDLKGIVTNWAAFMIIAGLVLLPSLYAWFNIKASWDPYSNTTGIKIAVSNNDHGTFINEQSINIGNQIIEELKENKELGWVFVDEASAFKGVKYGEYYASIIIPTDFSKKLTSFFVNEPEKPEIIYYVNEKENAIAPKITAKGATTIVEQVGSNFIKTTSKTLFQIFNKIGLEVQRELPTIHKLEEFVFQLEKIFPKMKEAVNLAVDEVTAADEFVRKSQDNLSILTNIIKNGNGFLNNTNLYINKIENIAHTISPNIKENLLLLQQIATKGKQVSTIIKTDKNNITTQFFDETISKLKSGIELTNSIYQIFFRANELTGKKIFIDELEQLQQVQTQLQNEITLITSLKNRMNESKQTNDEIVNQLQQSSTNAENTLKGLQSLYDKNTKPKMNEIFKLTKQSIETVQRLMNDADQLFPNVEKGMTNALNMINYGKNETIKFQQKMPALEAKITEIANRIRTFKQEENIDEIINLLLNDAEKESEFFAEPVVLKENQLFPIPNYGSAMSPFFTTLSLWVGALLLISVLTVEVKESEYKSFQIYFGRLFTFLTLALLQSFIVTLGDIILLKTYVANKYLFVLFGLVISTVFILIVYTLVSVFGNVGKAIAIIFLVLQIAGSGGTFPVQMTPPFFQLINPILPFTYAISMMRETVGGLLWAIAVKDLLFLTIFAGISLIIGLALKKPINQLSKPIMKKAKQSKLIH